MISNDLQTDGKIVHLDMSDPNEPKDPYSVEDYFDVSIASEPKVEYYSGYLHNMAGGSLEHSMISTNLIGALVDALKDTPCRPFDSNLRVHAREFNSFMYPDALVICGKPELLEDRRDTITNPSIVFEVLSESTQGLDRGKKMHRYLSIPSLQEYVLIEQSSPQADLYFRNENGDWIFVSYGLDEAGIFLHSLGFPLRFETLYRGVSFFNEED